LIISVIGCCHSFQIKASKLVAIHQRRLHCKTETTRFAGPPVRYDLHKPKGVNMLSGFLVLVLLATGCAPVAPQLDSRFGASVRTLMAQQTLPAQAYAGSDTFDAAAAHGALSQYRQSFQAPARAPRPQLGVTGGGSAAN
jgi:hypothetical protein